jgi:hypothetical protein
MASEVSTAGAQQDLCRRVAELERELSEAHRRETATGEVLKVIGRSTFNLQRVLDSLLESAVRLTRAEVGLIYRKDGEFCCAAAIYGASPEFIEVVKQNPIPLGPNRQQAGQRLSAGSSTSTMWRTIPSTGGRVSKEQRFAPSSLCQCSERIPLSA